MTTNVAITFDIEFDINGTFAMPDRRSPRGRDTLVCPINGRDAGLGQILDTLETHGLRATFFVEALQATWFSPDEMGEIARELYDRGHEVQLHLHPVWLTFAQADWRERCRMQPPQTATHDSLAALPPAEARGIIEQGLAVFAQWRLPRPTAIRTGNLIVERSLYAVFAACNLATSSSIGLGLYRPQDPELQKYSAACWFDGVLELPVTSFGGADPLLRRRDRLATIIGMGLREQAALLARAAELQLPFLVLLTHVSEFLSGNGQGHPTRNTLTATKFQRLCRTLRDHPQLRAATITELALAVANTPRQQDQRVTLPRTLSALRFLDSLTTREASA